MTDTPQGIDPEESERPEPDNPDAVSTNEVPEPDTSTAEPDGADVTKVAPEEPAGTPSTAPQPAGPVAEGGPAVGAGAAAGGRAGRGYVSSDGPIVLNDRYEMGEVIGRGGMAEVHRGRDLRLGRIVAIKALRVDLVTDETFQARFRREAQSSASLNHPNIVAVYDTGESEINGVAVPFIVMEYVEGRTLREILREEPRMSIEQSLSLTEEILRALDYSHRAGIVHRDIKPGNVMVTEAGQVKVMDFGIARAMGDAHQTMTQTSMVVGTAQYLSPEQARGETADARSDLYATGCVLYELLTNRPPFVGDSLVSVAMAHVKQPPRPPSALRAEIGKDVDSVVLTALAKDRLQRYQSAAEMRADVERARTGLPVAAVAPAPAAAATSVVPAVGAAGLEEEPPSDSRRNWLIGFAVFVVVVIAGVVGWALFRPGENQVRVPELIGLTVEDAQTTLEGRDLLLGETDEQPSQDYAAGVVSDQSPSASTLVDPDTAIDVVVSTGTERTVVPQVVGLEVADARSLLADAELVLGDVSEEASDQPEGTVLESDPAEGTEVDVETEVDLVTSSGEVAVPDVRGLSSDEAQAVLKQNGFEPIITEEVTEDAAEGTVLSQRPDPGTELSGGSIVNIVVAVAPEPTTEPTPDTTPQSTGPAAAQSPPAPTP